MLLIREINSALLLGILSLAMIGCSGDAAEPLVQPTIHDATGTTTSPQPTRQVTPKVSVPTYSPSATQVLGAIPPAQPAPSEVLFNPKEYPVECVDPILGSKNTDEILYGGRLPSQSEMDKIADCFHGTGVHRPNDDRRQSRGEGFIAQVGGQEKTQPSEALVSVSNLRNVSLPTPNHLSSDNTKCDNYQGKECVDLRWERIDGLLAGAITTLQVAPTDSTIIYAGIDSNGMSLYKSGNSGKNWNRVHEWAHASDVAISPANSSTILYSELEEGVYISTDNGGTWESVIGGEHPDWVRSSGLYFKALAFSIGTPEVAYAVASKERGPSSRPSEVFISKNGGLTWEHSGSCDECGSIYTVVVHPEDHTNVWLTGDFGVHLSKDSGKSWSGNLLTVTSPDKAATIGLAINPLDPRILLASTSSSGVYRSIDSGKTWSSSSSGLDTSKTHQVEFAPTEPNIAWLTTHDGVYRSEDSGQNWNRRDNGWGYTFTNALAIDPRDSNVVYVGTAVELMTAHSNHNNEGIHAEGGLYKTTNGGNSWEQIDHDMEESNVVAMATHPYLPFNLWVGDKAGRGAFVTNDGGDTWLHAAWRASHYPMVFAFSNSIPSKHFLSSAVGQGELTASADGGRTWVSLASGLGMAVDQSSRASRLPSETRDYFHVHLHGLAVAPSNPDVIYTGTIYDPSITEEYSMMGAVIFTSRDGGMTWTESSNGFPIDTPTSLNAFVVNPIDANTAYAMTSGYESTRAIGIYKTTDGGMTWRAVNEGLDPNTRDLQIDPLSPETLYAATGSGVYKTVDGAETWARVSNGLPMSGSYSAQEQLFNILRGSGTESGVFDLALDPQNPLSVYAATTKGVYKTKDGGANWYAVNFGLPLQGGNPFWHDRVLEIDATGRVVYTTLSPEKNGKRGDTQIYRAIVGPLIPVAYEFSLNGELLELESSSHVYDMGYDQEAQELSFTIAGPNGLDGETLVNIPASLLDAPFSVTVDGTAVSLSTQGQVVSFEYVHTGTSQVIIRSK